MRKKIIIFSLIAISISLFGSITPLLNYQGKLQENDLAYNGTVNMEFKIHDSLTGGNELWSSGTVSVSVKDGIFNYILGMNNGAVFEAINWNQNLYLEVTVNGENLSPRESITGVPYSLLARNVTITSNKLLSSWVTNGFMKLELFWHGIKI